MKDYVVLRVRFIDESEIHSAEYFDNELSALRRYSNIWATDINNTNVTWNGVFMFNYKYMNQFIRYDINDQRGTKNGFYILFRFFERNGSMNNSVQYYYPDRIDSSGEYVKAVKRWFSVIAADVNDNEVTANGALLFDSLAEVKEQRSFQNTVQNVSE